MILKSGKWLKIETPEIEKALSLPGDLGEPEEPEEHESFKRAHWINKMLKYNVIYTP